MGNSTGPTFVLGMFISLVIGAFSVIFVSTYNTKIDQAERRKQMVESGIGGYNARTGEFEFKKCLPDQQTE